MVAYLLFLWAACPAGGNQYKKQTFPSGCDTVNSLRSMNCVMEIQERLRNAILSCDGNSDKDICKELKKAQALIGIVKAAPGEVKQDRKDQSDEQAAHDEFVQAEMDMYSQMMLEETQQIKADTSGLMADEIAKSNSANAFLLQDHVSELEAMRTVDTALKAWIASTNGAVASGATARMNQLYRHYADREPKITKFVKRGFRTFIDGMLRMAKRNSAKLKSIVGRQKQGEDALGEPVLNLGASYIQTASGNKTDLGASYIQTASGNGGAGNTVDELSRSIASWFDPSANAGFNSDKLWYPNPHDGGSSFDTPTADKFKQTSGAMLGSYTAADETGPNYGGYKIDAAESGYTAKAEHDGLQRTVSNLEQESVDAKKYWERKFAGYESSFTKMDANMKKKFRNQMNQVTNARALYDTDMDAMEHSAHGEMENLVKSDDADLAVKEEKVGEALNSASDLQQRWERLIRDSTNTLSRESRDTQNQGTEEMMKGKEDLHDVEIQVNEQLNDAEEVAGEHDTNLRVEVDSFKKGVRNDIKGLSAWRDQEMGDLGAQIDRASAAQDGEIQVAENEVGAVADDAVSAAKAGWANASRSGDIAAQGQLADQQALADRQNKLVTLQTQYRTLSGTRIRAQDADLQLQSKDGAELMTKAAAEANKAKTDMQKAVHNSKKQLDSTVAQVTSDQARLAEKLAGKYRITAEATQVQTVQQESELTSQLTKLQRDLDRYLGNLSPAAQAKVREIQTQSMPAANVAVQSAEDAVAGVYSAIHVESQNILKANSEDIGKAMQAGTNLVNGQLQQKEALQARDVLHYKSASSEQMSGIVQEVSAQGMELHRQATDLESTASATRASLRSLQATDLELKKAQAAQFAPVFSEISDLSTQFIPETDKKVHAEIDKRAKQFRTDASKKIDKLGMDVAKHFQKDLHDRHGEIDRLVEAVAHAADAKHAEIKAVDEPVGRLLYELEKKEAELQNRLLYAAGNSSAVHDLILGATFQETGLVSTTSMLLTASGKAAEELLEKKANHAVAMITAKAENMTVEMQAEIKTIAAGAAQEMAAVLASAKFTGAEKRQKMLAIDEAMRSKMTELTGVVTSSTEGLMGFEQAENAWGAAMTDEDRKLGSLLHKAMSGRLDQVAAEKKTLARETARLDFFVQTVAGQLEALWTSEGGELTDAQASALAKLGAMGKRTSAMVSQRVEAAEQTESLAAKTKLLAENADTMTREELATIREEIEEEFKTVQLGVKNIAQNMFDVESVRKAALQASRDFTASSTEPTVAHILTIAQVLQLAAQNTQKNQNVLDDHQQKFALKMERLIQELMDEERGAVGAAVGDANAKDDLVWQDGEWQKRIGDKLMEHELLAQQKMDKINSALKVASENEAAAIRAKYGNATAAVTAAQKELEQAANQASREGSTDAQQVLDDANAWDGTVGKSVAVRAVKQRQEAQNVADDAVKHATELGTEDADVAQGAIVLRSRIRELVQQANAVTTYVDRYGAKRQAAADRSRSLALQKLQEVQERLEGRGVVLPQGVSEKLDEEEAATKDLEDSNEADRAELASLLDMAEAPRAEPAPTLK